MATFYTGSEKWELNITIGDVKRVKQLIGVDLLQPIPVSKPISNEFNKWLELGGFRFNELTAKQEMFLRQIFSEQDPQEATLLQQLQMDVVLLVDVLYGLVKPKADERGLDDQQFGTAISGEDLKRVIDAFWEAYEHFFRDWGNEPLEKLVSMYRRLVVKAMSAASELVDDQEVEEKANKLIDSLIQENLSEDADSTPGENSTKPLEQSESIPTPSHSES